MSAPAKSVDRPKACQHCSNPAHVRGLCQKHYMRLRRHGDPLLLRTPCKWQGDWPSACQVCGKPVRARGLCSKHYMRRYRAEQTPTAKPTPLMARRQGLAQLIARWRRRAEFLLTRAAQAWADGRDGEAIRWEREAELYEQVAAEAAPVAEGSNAD